MQVWASIDLLGGRVVSLLRGNPSTPLRWDLGGVEAARRWQNEGVDGLHVVDLDKAFGTGSNEDLVRKILDESRAPVQVGGGIRSSGDALRTLGLGATRVVIGTMAYVDPASFSEVVRKAGLDRVAAAVDFKGGQVLTHGWRRSRSIGLMEAVKSVQRLGCGTIVATAVDRDGTGEGPDFEAYERLQAGRKVRVLASGGIRSAEDMSRLESIGLEGVIIGRALYEGSVRLAELGVR